MPKAKPLTGPEDDTVRGHVVMCPACKSWHLFDDAKNGQHPRGASWTFNGDVEKPTFSPSMLVRLGPWPSQPDKPVQVCHSFVEDGKIRFLKDCTHELAGQTVDLPDVDTDWDG